MSNAPTATNNQSLPAVVRNLPNGNESVGHRFATKYGIAPSLLPQTLRDTAFKLSGNKVASDSQILALLVVADQYDLNPWTKEIFAFDDGRGGIIPVVSVDGWARIINSHPQYDGVEFTYSDEIITAPHPANGVSRSAHAWVESRIYRKDRSRPTVIREYFEEVYQAPRGGYAGAWQSHPKRFHRHKALIQGARIALGFAGIYDEDEGHRIVAANATPTANVDVIGIEDDLRRIAAERTADAAPIDVEHTEVVDADEVSDADEVDQRQEDEAVKAARIAEADRLWGENQST